MNDIGSSWIKPAFSHVLLTPSSSRTSHARLVVLNSASCQLFPIKKASVPTGWAQQRGSRQLTCLSYVERTKERGEGREGEKNFYVSQAMKLTPNGGQTKTREAVFLPSSRIESWLTNRLVWRTTRKAKSCKLLILKSFVEDKCISNQSKTFGFPWAFVRLEWSLDWERARLGASTISTTKIISSFTKLSSLIREKGFFCSFWIFINGRD